MKNQILIGDNRKILPTLPDKSVNCCVTSPPYYGLRDYQHPDQIGLEETPEQYIETMVQVFREVKRALKDDGTLWVNIGDSYAAGKVGRSDFFEGKRPDGKNCDLKGYEKPKQRALTDGLKPKDLIGIPWMLAFALRADGWYLRQDIIWAKPSPMPESVTDRCTKAHEYIFLLSKSQRYYYDAAAIAEPLAESTYQDKRLWKEDYAAPRRERNYPGNPQQGSGLLKPNGETRNKRSVWTVATRPYSGAHFAVFPPKLIEPCILAGCPEGGTVLDPFGGSGTTAQVANMHRRNAITIEINPDYVGLQKKRINGTQIQAF